MPAKNKGFSTHPDYDKLYDKWMFYLLTYEGGDEYKEVGGKDYLYQHTREIIIFVLNVQSLNQ